MLAAGLVAEPVRVRHQQGEVHAFLAIRSDEGKLLGTADEVNVPIGKAWRSRLTLHFLDGSVDDDTATYTQDPVLHLLSDHRVQKGPSFPKPSDVMIDVAKGSVVYHDFGNGKDEIKTEHMDLPDDLGNGIMPMVLQNFSRDTELKIGYLVNVPKPRLVKLAVRADGTEHFHVGGASRSAVKYRLHVEIGGIEGFLAPLVGKEPPDLMAWVSSGTAPTLLKLRGFLYLGGPMWRLELASPQW